MIKSFQEYKFVIFDCDGVILNSNKVKSHAFYKIASHYGEQVASEFLNYHKRNGGISRQVKLRYLLENLLNIFNEIEYESLLHEFSSLMQGVLQNAEVVEGLYDLRRLNSDQRWFVASGGDEEELQNVFDYKRISHLWDLGIHGNRRSKYQIVIDIMKEEKVNVSDVLFLGDSPLDYEVSRYFNYDFIFVSQWTELENWERFVEVNRIKSVHSLTNLIL